MIPLSVNSQITLNTVNLIRIGDIAYFEGPLLTLFEEIESEHFYLFDWIDRNMQSNRWLVYQVLPNSLLYFLQNKISHLELFLSNPSKIIYYTDIVGATVNLQNLPVFQLTELPPAYLPNSDNFFDIDDCPAYNRICAVVLKSLSRNKQQNEYTYSPFSVHHYKNWAATTTKKLFSAKQTSIFFHSLPVNNFRPAQLHCLNRLF